MNDMCAGKKNLPKAKRYHFFKREAPRSTQSKSCLWELKLSVFIKTGFSFVRRKDKSQITKSQNLLVTLKQIADFKLVLSY